MVHMHKKDQRASVAERIRKAINRFKNADIVEAEELERNKKYLEAGRAFLAIGKAARVYRIIRKCKKLHGEGAALLFFEIAKTTNDETERYLCLGRALDMTMRLARERKHWEAAHLFDLFGLSRQAEEQRRLGNLHHDDPHTYWREISRI